MISAQAPPRHLNTCPTWRPWASADLGLHAMPRTQTTPSPTPHLCSSSTRLSRLSLLLILCPMPGTLIPRFFIFSTNSSGSQPCIDMVGQGMREVSGVLVIGCRGSRLSRGSSSPAQSQCHARRQGNVPGAMRLFPGLFIGRPTLPTNPSPSQPSPRPRPP